MISGIGGASLLGGHKISAFPAGSNLGTIVGSLDLAKEKLNKALRKLDSYLPLQKPSISENDIIYAKKIFKKKGFEFRYYDSYIYIQEDLIHAYEKILLQLQNTGATICLNTEVTHISFKNDYFKIIIQQGSCIYEITSKYLIIGVGRLGKNFLRSLNRELNLGGKENNLEIGIRLEFLTEICPDIDKYHRDLKILYKDSRTFCICKGGKLAPYYLDDIFIVDGFLDPSNKTNFTNLAIVLRLKSSDRNDEIFHEIRKRTTQNSCGRPIRQMLLNYLNINVKNKTPTSFTGNSISFWVDGNVSQCFPESLSTRIRESVYQFVLTNLSKTSWEKVSVFAPVIEYFWMKFPVKSDFSIFPRMYLIGDCAGQFRGILQAFCSGIMSAESVIGKVYENKN